MMSNPQTVIREMQFFKHSHHMRAEVKVLLAYLGRLKALGNAAIAMMDGFNSIIMTQIWIQDAALINKFQSGEKTVPPCDDCSSYIYAPSGTCCEHKPAQ